MATKKKATKRTFKKKAIVGGFIPGGTVLTAAVGKVRTTKKTKATKKKATTKTKKATVSRDIIKTEKMSVTGLVKLDPVPNFSFRVPVELKNLHSDISHVRVNCIVVRSPHFIPKPTVRIGQGISEAYKIVKGQFSGIVDVAVDADSNKNPSLARSYRCDLHLKIKGKWGLVPTNDTTYPINSKKLFRRITQGKLTKAP